MATMRALWTTAVLILVIGVVVATIKDMGWEYGERSYKRCRQRGTAIPKGSCSRLQDVIEGSFDTMGVNLANIFNMSTRDADQFGRSETFKLNMDKLVDGVIDVIIEKSITKENEIAREFQMKFFKWYTNVLKNEPEPDLSNLMGKMGGGPGGIKFTGPGGQQGMPPNFNPDNAPWLQKDKKPAEPQKEL